VTRPLYFPEHPEHPGYSRRIGNLERRLGVSQTSLKPPVTPRGTRWATIVVAASNSSDEGKAVADFLCDGITDGATIEAAMAECPIGGKVVLLEGDYYGIGLHGFMGS
jgi:hypothetical protein